MRGWVHPGKGQRLVTGLALKRQVTACIRSYMCNSESSGSPVYVHVFKVVEKAAAQTHVRTGFKFKSNWPIKSHDQHFCYETGLQMKWVSC